MKTVRRIVRDELQRHLYPAHVGLAEVALKNNNMRRVNALLKQYVPDSGGANKAGAVATLGGITVEVVGQTAGQTSMTQSSGKEHTLILGDVNVRIEDQRLSVNQQHYGVVKQGDVVKAREDGTVIVNGQQRIPQPD